MARIRTIKPEFWHHEELSELPEATHLLAAALLNYADDDGYFNANPRLIQAACSPLREPSVSIHTSLTRLQEIGYLRLGRTEDGKNVGLIINFTEHQVINRKTESKIKNLKIVWEPSVSTHGALSEPSLLEGKGREGNRKGKDISVAPAPSPDAAEFEVFYGLYPKKTAKDAARRAFRAALKKASVVEILNGVKRYAQQRKGEDPQFTKNPSTWLNGGCWADMIDPAAKRNKRNGSDEFVGLGGMPLKELS